jgi:hydrogenase maturation factor
VNPRIYPQITQISQIKKNESIEIVASFEDAPFCVPDAEGHCSICSDEGIPGRVLALRPFNMALLQMPTGELEVAIDLIDNVQIDDVLLVHVGVAITRICNEDEGNEQ